MRLQSNEQYLNYCLVGGSYILVIFAYITKSTNRETAEIKTFSYAYNRDALCKHLQCITICGVGKPTFYVMVY
jgi:hypothetical protein